MSKLLSVSLFSPEGDDTKYTVWGGNPTGIVNLSAPLYPWAVQLYNQMLANFWIPETPDLTMDRVDYLDLSPSERKAYYGILSYLTFLDSVQTRFLGHLKLPIVAPEIDLVISQQISQEALHNRSYQVLIEAVIPPDERAGIYTFWKSDLVLKERCTHISAVYQRYVNNPTPDNYFAALVADYILEGIYFYNGFSFFYSLAARQRMQGSAVMAKYIQRDEATHTYGMRQILLRAMKELSHSISTEQIYEMVDLAVTYECLWTNHIVGDDVLGINSTSTEQYTKHLANLRLTNIGLKPLYPDFKRNPYKHLERFADLGSNGDVRGNFFENTVTSYTQPDSLTDWDF